MGSLVCDFTSQSWSASLYSENSSFYMTGLSILGDVLTSASGITFYFNDGSSKTVGSKYNQKSSILKLENLNDLAYFKTFADLKLDTLKVCNSFDTCVEAGPLGNSSFKRTNINSNWNVTIFWGSLTASSN